MLSVRYPVWQWRITRPSAIFWVRYLISHVLYRFFALIPLFYSVVWYWSCTSDRIIALGTSVVLGVTTLEAIRNVPTIYVRAALTLGADRQKIYSTVIVPYIIPHLIGAIRVAAAASWGLDVAAEFMGSQAGLGYLIILQQTYLRTAGIVLLVIIYSILAVLMDTIIARLEEKITRWTERRSGECRRCCFYRRKCLEGRCTSKRSRNNNYYFKSQL